MKKRVLSALLVLCMACSMVSTVWAEGTNATSGAPEPASQTLNLDNEQSGDESGADGTGASSDSTDSASASSDSTSSGSSSAASDATSGAVSDATSGEGDEGAASSDSTAASDSTSSSSSASSDSSDSNADDQDAASSDVTGDESSTGTEEENDPAVEQPSAGNGITVTDESGDVPTVLAETDNGVEQYDLSSEGLPIVTIYDGSQKLVAYVMDSNGNAIEASTTSVTINNNDINSIASQIQVPEGYEFDKASIHWTKEDAVKGNDDDISHLDYRSGKWKYRTGSYNWKDVDEKGSVYFIFKSNKTTVNVVKRIDGIANIENLDTYTATVQLSWNGGNATVTFTGADFKDADGNLKRTATKPVTISTNNTMLTVQETEVSEQPASVRYRTQDGKETNSFWVQKGGQYTITVTNTYTNNATGGETSATVTTNKEAIKNDDDTYNLTLGVTGNRGSSGTVTAIDLMFIVDKSGSMKQALNSDSDDAAPAGEQRMDYLEQAVSNLLDEVDTQENIDVDYAVISFESSSGDDDVMSWGTASQAEDYISALPANGGTNYQQAIANAKSVLTARSAANQQSGRNALTYVVFISDGDPTYRWTSSGKWNGEDDLGCQPTNKNEWTIQAAYEDYRGTGSADKYGFNIYAAVAEIGNLNCDAFYAIGMGPTFGQGKYDSYYQYNGPGNKLTSVQANDSDFTKDKPGTVNLKRLAAAALGLDDTSSALNNYVFSATDTEKLQSAFDQIGEDIRFFAAQDVEMVDPLSQYAEIVPASGEDGSPQYEFTVTLQKLQNGNWVNDDTQPSETVRVTASGELVQGYSWPSFTTTVAGSASPTMVYIKPWYDADGNGTIHAKLFANADCTDATYELAEGYRYLVTTKIQPSEQAKTAGEDAYNGTGGASTGTHTNQNGFWSNDYEQTGNDYVTKAKVIYTANGKFDFTLFPMPVIQVPEETTTTLTLTKTFDGLSDAEVQYLLFEQGSGADNFGFDVNYCVTEAWKRTNGTLTYMAPSKDIEGLYLPDGTLLSSLTENSGGGYRIVAGEYLTNKDVGTYGNSYVDTTKGGSMTKDADGNWVYSITLTVPVTDENHFFTVFEQHQEVPGYAKINDSNAEWSIDYNTESTEDALETGYGKFIEGSKNIYENMSDVGDYSGYNSREEVCIKDGYFKQIIITNPTKISFTNHYTGNLDVTKKIGTDNDYTDANTKEYTLTIAPAHLWKLDFEKGATESTEINSIHHGLNGKSVSYYIETASGNRVDEDGNTLEDGVYATKTLDANGSFTISITPDQTIHFSDMPAIQWKVTENETAAAEEGYTLGVDYSDANNGVVNNAEHWNEYKSKDTIGGTNATDVNNGKGDGVASVDSAKWNVEDKYVDADAVALVTVTNTYTQNERELTVTKIVDGAMGDTTDATKFTFELTLHEDSSSENITGAGDLEATIAGTKETLTPNEQGVYTFKMSHGQDAVITIPAGYTAAVKETYDGGYSTYWKVSDTDTVAAAGTTRTGDTETVDNGYDKWVTEKNYTLGKIATASGDGDQTITFVNYRGVVAPTGLESNHTTPYVLMITAAGMAGLALIGGMAARRIRRRRQE